MVAVLFEVVEGILHQERCDAFAAVARRRCKPAESAQAQTRLAETHRLGRDAQCPRDLPFPHGNTRVFGFLTRILRPAALEPIARHLRLPRSAPGQSACWRAEALPAILPT